MLRADIWLMATASTSTANKRVCLCLTKLSRVKLIAQTKHQTCTKQSKNPLTSTVCERTAFSLNFTLALSAVLLCRTPQAYCVMLRADIWLIATFSTSTAGLLGFGLGDGEGGAAAGTEPASTTRQQECVLISAGRL